VRGVLGEAKRGIAIASSLGFAHSLFHSRGPFPPVDTMGVGTAVVIIQCSLDQGWYSHHVQYETICKFHAAASNIFHLSVDGQGAMVMAKDTRKLQVTECPTYADFFERFNKGLHKRMGDIVQRDRALSHPILKEILLAVDEDWKRATKVEDKLRYALEGAYYVLAFTLALRGEEIPLIELCRIHHHLRMGMEHTKPHVMISLPGRFKNEIGESYHLMPALSTTPRGLEPGKWTQRVLGEYAKQNIYSGYMFRKPDGTKLKSKNMEPRFFERLVKLQSTRSDLIE
jgi:ribosomal protein S10